jgi:hypothetical protein
MATKIYGYLVHGFIKGQGAPYLEAPSCDYCEVVYNEDDKKYYFYIGGDLKLVASVLSGQTWEVEIDSFENRLFWGEYWDFIPPEEMEYIYKEVLGEGETLSDWLREKYEGWGL